MGCGKEVGGRANCVGTEKAGAGAGEPRVFCCTTGSERPSTGQRVEEEGEIAVSYAAGGGGAQEYYSKTWDNG